MTATPLLRVSLACTMLLAAFGSAGADGGFSAAAGRLPPNLSAVVSCASKDGSGQHRAVVFAQGFEHVSSKVYLQRLESGEDGPRLLKSVLVAELSTGMWSVGSASVLSRNGCAFEFDATHAYSAQQATFIVRPTASGKYSVRLRDASERR